MLLHSGSLERKGDPCRHQNLYKSDSNLKERGRISCDDINVNPGGYTSTLFFVSRCASLLPLWFDLLHQETTHNPFWFPSTARRPRSSQTPQQLISLIKDVIERVLINEGRCCYFFFSRWTKKKKKTLPTKQSGDSLLEKQGNKRPQLFKLGERERKYKSEKGSEAKSLHQKALIPQQSEGDVFTKMSRLIHY